MHTRWIDAKSEVLETVEEMRNIRVFLEKVVRTRGKMFRQTSCVKRNVVLIGMTQR